MLDNQLDSIRKNFSKYLDSLGLSAKTHKNYRSDLSHFTGWIILKVRSFGSYVETLSEAVPFINHDIAIEYKNFMLENSIPEKTVNRRLSTLRHLSRFLHSTEMIDSDFMEGVENATKAKVAKSTVEPMVTEFRAYLEKEKVSANTIKNYLSDIRQFLVWLESNQPNLTNKTN